MGIIKIIGEFFIMLICSLIQVVGVVFEGVSAFFAKLAEYLCVAYETLMVLVKDNDKEADT